MLSLWQHCRKIQLRNTHDAILALGLFIGLCYFPNWLRFLFYQVTGYASGSFTLAICLVFVSVLHLSRHYHRLSETKAVDADLWLGHALVVIGILLFPFCQATLWLQALFWLLILVGIAIGLWGMAFFQSYPGLTLSVALSVYPNPGHILKGVWQMLMPTQFLEAMMAVLTSFALRVMGYPVSTAGPVIIFPDHHVKVGWACNGLDMALAMTGVSLLLGYLFRLSRRQIFMICCVGSVMALGINVPRLVLMSLAAVYWGAEVFEFWHGSWGGQVFVACLLVGYYFYFLRQVSRESPVK